MADASPTIKAEPWPELIELARRHGIATDYHDWRGRHVAVGAATLVAVLRAFDVDAATPDACRRALDAADAGPVAPGCVVLRVGEVGHRVTINTPPGTSLETWLELEDGGRRGDLGRVVSGDSVAVLLPRGLPVGWHTLHTVVAGTPHQTAVAVAPTRLTPPEGIRDRRCWGFTLQLHSVRSSRSWGMGDLGDLADLARAAGYELGAGFLVANPLHAGSPVPPAEASPYLPTTRRFFDPIHLRVEDVPEYAYASPEVRERAAAFGEEQRKRDGSDDLLDRDAVWAAKRSALRLLHQVPASPGRAAAFRAFRRREGRALTDYARWCALKEGAVGRDLPSEIDFHCWLQWQVDEQLAAVRRAAHASGMALGIVHDLAVGSAADGADTWATPGAYAAGITTGAPPDAFNQLGQTWGSRPWRPDQLAASGYAPYRAMLRAVLRHADGLRMDHVMGLFRLWWVPDGMSADGGTYVSYDHNAMLGILALEAQRAGALVIGEDLGTVEPWVRTELTSWGIFGTSVLWFERDEAGGPLPPDRWRADCLATVTTHDLPPTAAYLSGDHVTLRERLGLLTRPVEEELAADRGAVDGWLDLLRSAGLLRRGAGEQETVEALHRILGWSPARLVGVWLPDAVGDRRPHNLPGTTGDVYPSWRLPMADGAGRPVLLDDVLRSPRVRSLARVLRTI